MERLIIILPKDTEILRGQSGDSDSFFSKPGEKVFIYPDQDPDSGRLKVALIENGKELTEKFFVCIVESRKEQLKKALTKFNSADSAFLSTREKLELLTEIESCISGSEVVGPDSLKPF